MAQQLSSEGISIELLPVYLAFTNRWINQESMKTISLSFKLSKLLNMVMNQWEESKRSQWSQFIAGGKGRERAESREKDD